MHVICLAYLVAIPILAFEARFCLGNETSVVKAIFVSETVP